MKLQKDVTENVRKLLKTLRDKSGICEMENFKEIRRKECNRCESEKIRTSIEIQNSWTGTILPTGNQAKETVTSISIQKLFLPLIFCMVNEGKFKLQFLTILCIIYDVS